MIVLLLGVATLLVLMAALGMFSRAQVDTLKAFGVWIVALGGLVLAALLFLTGRGPTAIAALAMLGPLVWSWMGDGGAAPPKRGPARPAPNGAMSRAEAYEVLGLKPGATRGGDQGRPFAPDARPPIRIAAARTGWQRGSTRRVTCCCRRFQCAVTSAYRKVLRRWGSMRHADGTRVLRLGLPYSGQPGMEKGKSGMNKDATS